MPAAVAPMAAVALAVVSLSPARVPTTAQPGFGPVSGSALREAGGDLPRAGVPVTLPDPGTTGAATGTRLRGSWQWPLQPRPAVLRPFVAPQTRYGPGHRGVDLAGRPGQPVSAVAAGTVSHVGVIAGRGTVTVLHADGLRSTYEPLDALVRVGEAVRVGQELGRLSGGGSHCTPGSCLHLGALRGESYLDPLSLLGQRRVRLLPLR